MPLIPPNSGHRRDQTLNISPCSSCCMLGHCHTCPWLLVSRVPHPAGSPRLFVIQIIRVCHSLLYGTLGWGGGRAERDAGIEMGIREMGGGGRERERKGGARKRCRRKWTKGSIMTYQWSALVIKDNREEGDKRVLSVGKDCGKEEVCPVVQSPSCKSWI